MAAHGTEHLGAPALEETRPPLTLRAFFGLPLPEPQRRALGPYLTTCAALAPDFRWIPLANLHLTVRFVGSVERSVVEVIADRLVEQPLPAFDLRLGELGTFKRGRLARVVWLHVTQGADSARELASRVEAECVRAGLAPEARTFQPHLTLARARSREGSVVPELPEPPELGLWPADELILYRSRLGRAGSVYEPIRSITLG